MHFERLRGYLQEVGQASEVQLRAQFPRQSDQIDYMLEFLCRKGLVRCRQGSGTCGSCVQCPTAQIRHYEWVR